MFPLSLQRILITLFTLDALFMLCYFLARSMGSEALLFLFDLDRELTLASWYASSKLLLIALALVLNKHTEVLNKHTEQKSPLRALFLLAGLGFLFLSADEAASIHEGLAELFQYEGWFVMYGVAGLILFALFFGKVRQAWQSYRLPSILLGVGLGVMVGGSVGVEELRQELLGLGQSWYTVQVLLEEGLELLGASLILYAALLFARADAKTFANTTLSNTTPTNTTSVSSPRAKAARAEANSYEVD